MNDMRSPYDPPKKCIPEDPEAGRLAEAIRRDLRTTEGAVRAIGLVYLVQGGLLIVSILYAVVPQSAGAAMQVTRHLSGWLTLIYVVALCISGAGVFILRRFAWRLLLGLLVFPVLPILYRGVELPPALLRPYAMNQVAITHLWVLALGVYTLFVLVTSDVAAVTTASYRRLMASTPSVPPPSIGSHVTRMLLATLCSMWLLAELIGYRMF